MRTAAIPKPTALAHSTTLAGVPLWIAWVLWSTLAGLVVAVAVASFDSLLSSDLGLVESQGPLALQPGLARELQTRLFDADLLKAGQRTVHVAGSALFAAAAVLVFVRRPRDWVILLSSATLLAAGVAMFVPSSVLAAARESWEPAVAVVGVFDGNPAFWRSIAGVAIVLFALLFPDGRFTAPWTRVFAVVVLAEVALWAALPGVAIFDVTRWPLVLQIAWTLGIPLALVAGQLDRYFRYSSVAVRRQTRLVVISLASAVGTLALIWILSPDLSQNFDFGLVLVTPRLQAIYDLNLLTLLTVSVVLFPISIGVSVARYQLFDMDLILNRALVYGSLTGVIALVLLGTATLVGNLVVSTFGRSVGVAVTGVLVVALFQPLRSRIQTQVDRRFYREKYNADRTVAAFAEHIRDEADLDALVRDLLDVVNVTLRPATVRMFLNRAEDDHPAEHLALHDSYLEEPNRPRLIGESGLEPEAGLAADNIAAVVPLVSHQEVVGVLELGPRLGDRSYSGIDQQLLRQLAERVAPAIRYALLAEQHAREAVAKERYEQELILARTIQRDLLPKRLPDLPGWELGALYEPAREVGGDLYDLINLTGGRWAIVVADVTDKGVPAAMVMASCRSVLRGVASSSDAPGPGEVLRRANEILLPDTPEHMFVTCFYAVIDSASGLLTYANAGHPLPLLWSDTIEQIDAKGMPLGLMPGMAYDEGERTIAPGENLLFYSDGVTEAHNSDGEMFGTERLSGWLLGQVVGQNVLAGLMSELQAFVHPSDDLGDDVTLVALRRHPEAPPG